MCFQIKLGVMGNDKFSSWGLYSVQISAILTQNPKNIKPKHLKRANPTFSRKKTSHAVCTVTHLIKKQ